MMQVIGDEIWFDSYRVGFVDRVGMMGPACPATIVERFERSLQEANRDTDDEVTKVGRVAYRAGFSAGFKDAVESMGVDDDDRPDETVLADDEVDRAVNTALEEAA